jgi:hypothetical protein
MSQSHDAAVLRRVGVRTPFTHSAHEQLAILPSRGPAGLRALQSQPAIDPMALPEKLVVAGKTLFDKSVLLVFGTRLPVFLRCASKANEFHGSFLESVIVSDATRVPRPGQLAARSGALVVTLSCN